MHGVTSPPGFARKVVLPDRVLVTGSYGFVGRHLVGKIRRRFAGACVIEHARRPNGDETGPRHLDAGRETSMDIDGRPACEPVYGDLADHSAAMAVIREARPTAIVHLAGHASAGTATRDVAKTWRDNETASRELGRAVARYTPDATVIVASTCEVYGDSFRGGSANEETPPAPRGPYAESKLAAEKALIEAVGPRAQVIVCRPVNHTGAGQTTTFVVPAFCCQVAEIEAGKRGASLSHGNLSSQRDFLDVNDVCDAYVRLLAVAGALSKREVFNISRGRCFPIGAILDHLRCRARVPFDTMLDPTRIRPNEVTRIAVNSDRLRDMTGWSPALSFDATLDRVLQDWRERQGVPA